MARYKTLQRGETTYLVLNQMLLRNTESKSNAVSSIKKIYCRFNYNLIRNNVT